MWEQGDSVRTQEVIVKAIHYTQCSIKETHSMSGVTCAASSRLSPSLSPHSFQDKGLSSQCCVKYQRTSPHFLEIKERSGDEWQGQGANSHLLHVSIYTCAYNTCTLRNAEDEIYMVLRVALIVNTCTYGVLGGVRL